MQSPQPRKRSLWPPVAGALGLFVILAVIVLAVMPRTPIPAAAPRTIQPRTVEQSLVVDNTFGSVWQAEALLNLMAANPNAATYRIVATSPAGETVTLVVDNANGTLSRRHVKEDGRGTFETWRGEVQARVRNTAAGGTFNDVPSGKSLGTFQTF